MAAARRMIWRMRQRRRVTAQAKRKRERSFGRPEATPPASGSRCSSHRQRKAKDLTQSAQRKTGEHRERSRHTANSKVSASAKNRPRRHRGKLGQPFDPAPRDLRMNRAVARFTRSAPRIITSAMVLEPEDQACVGYRAVLVGVEV